MVRDARSRAGTLLLCLAAAFIPAGGPARGGQPAPGALSEYQIKAAYLYYFSTFVDWPPEAFSRGREPLVVGVLGVDPFGAILTVGDIDRFASRGGQIAFRMEDKKVRFDINVAAVERARLRISAQLMKLGRIVEEAGRQGG